MLNVANNLTVPGVVMLNVATLNVVAPLPAKRHYVGLKEKISEPKLGLEDFDVA